MSAEREFLDTLLRQKPADRGDVITRHLTAAIARELQLAPDRISADTVWGEDGNAFDFIAGLVRRDFEILLYPVERHDFQCLRSLGKYLARELFGDGLAVPTADVEDPHEGAEWGWSLPGKHQGPKVPSIVLLLSAPRSGSTLLRVMLAGHAGLFSPPELHLMPFETMGGRSQDLGRLDSSWMRHGIRSAMAEAYNCTELDAERNIRLLEDVDCGIDGVYLELLRRIGRRRLVDKSPTYAFHPAWLNRAEQLFERPHYLFLVRHPNATIESIVRRRFHRLFARHWLLQDANPWRFAEKCWLACNLNISEFLRGVAPERQHRIHFEDLVLNPQNTMSALCESMDLAFDYAVLSPYEGNRMTVRSSDGSVTLGDPYFLDRDHIDPGIAQASKTGIRHRLGPAACQLATSLGYEL